MNYFRFKINIFVKLYKSFNNVIQNITYNTPTITPIIKPIYISPNLLKIQHQPFGNHNPLYGN